MKSRDSLIRLKRFQVDEKRRQLMQIETMMAEFQRMADDLDREIKREQERSGITDESHYAYPTYARAAGKRRDNLVESAENLKTQLNDAQDQLNEALEELKKIEMIDQRDQDQAKAHDNQVEQAQLEEAYRNSRSSNRSNLKMQL